MYEDVGECVEEMARAASDNTQENKNTLSDDTQQEEPGELPSAAELIGFYSSVLKVNLDLKPGTMAYYNQRWLDSIEKVEKTGKNGNSVWADTSTKSNSGGALVPWNGNLNPAKPAGITQDADGSYKIYNAEHLRWALINEESCRLYQDIDLGGERGRNWKAVDIAEGITIDGNYHTVWNMYTCEDNSADWETNFRPTIGFLGYVTHEDFLLKDFYMSNSRCEGYHQRSGRAATIIACFRGGSVENCGLDNALVGPMSNDDGSPKQPSEDFIFSGVGGAFDTANSPPTASINIKNTYTKNVHVRGTGCVGNFFEGGWNRSPDLGDVSLVKITDSAAMEGSVISSSGHSGGFISCTGYTEVDNCFANLDCYGSRQTGVFCGVIHRPVKISNSWASGKVEGVRYSGGFVSGGEQLEEVSSSFTNCYTTVMVGMGATAEYMGGFAGAAFNVRYEEAGREFWPEIIFRNCYSAGEVGTLLSRSDGTALDENENVVESVGGFAGVSPDDCSSYTNCYYDKQTSASCEKGINNASDARVTGLLTKDLAELPTARLGDPAGNIWVQSNGSAYPQLKVFTENGWAAGNPRLQAYGKAYSQASVSTAFLYPSMLEGAEYDTAKAGGDYDTVRRIRYNFPLTNDNKVNDPSIKTTWEYDKENELYYPNASPLSPDADNPVPIITLNTDADPSLMPRAEVTSVASGIGWLRVFSEVGDIAGTRNLRLVPTTSVVFGEDEYAIVGSDATIYSLPKNNLPGYIPFDDNEIAEEDICLTFDHGEDVTLIGANSVALQKYLDRQEAGDTDGKTPEEILAIMEECGISFGTLNDTATLVSSGDPGYSPDPTHLDYRYDYQNQTIRVQVKKVLADASGTGTYLSSALSWDADNNHLFNVFTGAVQPDFDDIGKYVLEYAWLDSTGAAVQASGAKYVTIIPPLSLVYFLNYDTGENASRIHAIDAGAYRNFQSIDDRAASVAKSLPAAPVRTGYNFTGWVYERDGAAFTANTPITAVTDGAGYTDSVVYLNATWEVRTHDLIVQDAQGILPPVTIQGVPFEENIRDTLDANAALLADYVTQDLLGFEVVSGLDHLTGAFLPATEPMPDNTVVLTPIYGEEKIVGEKTAYNATQGELAGDALNYAGDEIEFSLTFENISGEEIVIDEVRDPLSSGFDYKAGSAYLILPDGSQVSVTPSVDASHHLVWDAQGTLTLKPYDTFMFTFSVTLNNSAVNLFAIRNAAQVAGHTEDGGLVYAITNTVTLPGNGEVVYAPADKWIEKEATNATNGGGSSASVGDVIDYTISMGNKSTNPASVWDDGIIYDEIPQGLEVIPHTIKMTVPDPDTPGNSLTILFPSAYDPVTRTIAVFAGPLRAGEHVTLEFSAYVTEDAIGTSIKNTAWGVSDGEGPHEPGPVDPGEVPDPDPNNPDPGPTDPVGPGEEGTPVLSLAKSAPVTHVVPGANFPYTITLTNSGDAPAKGVAIKDMLPPELEYVSALPTPQVSSTGELSWIADVPAGYSITRTVLVKIKEDTPLGTDIVNSARAVPDTQDPESDLEASATVTVVEQTEEGSVTITKAASADTVYSKGTLTYTLFVSNNTADDKEGVRVIDPLPKGSLFHSASKGGTHSKGTVSWELDIPAHTTEVLTVTVSVTAQTGTLINQASVVADNMVNTSNTTLTPIVSDVALAITKRAPYSSAPQGTIVPYTITVTNTGVKTAKNVRVTDVLPAGLTYVSSTPAGTYSPDDNTVVWITDIGAGKTVTFEIRGELTGSVGNTVTNAVTAKHPATDEVTPGRLPDILITGDTDTDPHLTITKRADKTTVQQNDTLTYTLAVQNSGGKAAQGVTVTDTLPQGTVFNAAASSADLNYNAATHTITWTGDVEAGEIVSLDVSLTVAAARGTLINQAEVVYNTQTRPSNIVEVDVVADPEEPETSDLYLTKHASTDKAAPGAQVTYTLELVNLGAASAENVSLADEIPDGYTYVSSNPEGTLAADGKSVTWNIASVASGQTITRTLTLQVESDATGFLENKVTASAEGEEDLEFTDNPGVEVVFPTEPAPSLSLLKTVDHTKAVQGDTLTYTLVLSNTGTADATGVSVTDVLDGGLTYVSSTPPATVTTAIPLWDADPLQCTLPFAARASDTTLTWIVDIAAGEVLTFTIVADVAIEEGTVRNSAAVEHAGTTSSSNEVRTLVEKEPEPAASVALRKTASVHEANPSDTFTYTIMVSNLGDGPASNVVVRDTLSAGLIYEPTLSAPLATQDPADPQKLSWTLATLAPGESVPLTVGVRVAPGAPLGITTNTAFATDPAYPEVTEESSVDVLITDREITDSPFELTKEASVNEAHTGDVFTYTLTLTNTGSTTSGFTLVSDVIPAGLELVHIHPHPDASGGASGNTVNWMIPAGLAPGATITLSFDVRVTASLGTIVNSGTAHADNKTTSSNDVAVVITEPEYTSDISVEKTTSATEAAPGSLIVWAITVTNSGGADAHAVTVTDVLPKNLTYVSSMPSATQDPADPQKLTWTVDVSAHDSHTIILTTRVADNALGNIRNTVTVIDPTDPETPIIPPEIPEVPVIDPEAGASIGITKRASADTVFSGDSLTYTLTVTNSGTADATGVRVADTLPPGTTFVSASDGGVYGAGEVTWVLDIPAATQKELTVTVHVDASPGNSLVNTALVTHREKESSATVITPVDPTGEGEGALAVEKTVSATQVAPGATLAYTITVTNLTDAVLTQVNITDELESGLEYVSSTPTASRSGSTLTWTTTLSPGEHATFTVYAKVVAEIGEVIENIALAEHESESAADSAPEVEVVDPSTLPKVDISLIKYAEKDSALAHSRFVYQVSVFNNGSEKATGVEVTDTLPKNATFLEASSGGTYDTSTHTVTWVTDIEPASYQTFQVSVRVDAERGLLINEASAEHEGVQTLPSVVITPIVDGVLAPDPVPALTKQAVNLDAVEEGRDESLDACVDRDVIEFTIIAKNDKQILLIDNPAYDESDPTSDKYIEIETDTLWKDVVLTDTLPEGLDLVYGSLTYKAPGDTTFVVLAAADAYDTDTRTLTVPVGDIQGGEEAVLVYRATIIANEDTSKDGILENKVVSAGYTDAGTSVILEDSVQIITPVPQPIKELIKTGENLTDPKDFRPQIGDILKYTITITNAEMHPDSCWENAYIYDLVPEGLDVYAETLVLIDGTGQEHRIPNCYDPLTREIIVSTGPLFGGESASVSFEAYVSPLALGKDISNVGYVGDLDPVDPGTPEGPGAPGEGTLPDDPKPGEPSEGDKNPNPAPTEPTPPNESGEVDYADPVPALNKRVINENGRALFYTGDTVLYTITISNTGPYSMWKDVTVTDTIPLGATLDTRSIILIDPAGTTTWINGSTYNPDTRTLSVFIGDIAGGERYTLSYRATLDFSQASGDITNAVEGIGTDTQGGLETGDSKVTIYRRNPWSPGSLAQTGDLKSLMTTLLFAIASSLTALALLRRKRRQEQADTTEHYRTILS